METILLFGLSTAAWLTIATVVIVFALMIFTKLPADFVFIGSMAFLYITGILDTKEALHGFSSDSVVTVGVLFIVVAALTATGVLRWISQKLLGTPKSYAGAIAHLMIPVSALSAFLSNTAVVAMFINVVTIWSKKLNIAPSRLLIPLSYASVLGGVCTLIGTPPNLIISGLYHNATGQTIGMFDITGIGLICWTVGFLTILLFNKLLPVRKSAGEVFSSTQDFTVELLVPSDCPSIGQTLEEAGLYDVDGGHIIELLRFDKEIISPVMKDEFIMGGDRLIYTGRPEKILQLRSSHKLVTASTHVYSFNDLQTTDRRQALVTIPDNSALIGRKLSRIHFEEKHNVVLVAISRDGKRVEESPREVPLYPGDTLLLECTEAFLNTADDYQKEFLLLNKVEKEAPINGKTLLAGLIMLAMILLTAFNVFSLLQAALLAAFAMIVTRCCSISKARDTIDWSVLMIFAGSLALGSAIQKTGIASVVAHNLLESCGSHPLIAMGAIYLVTTIMTEFISNTAASAIIFPIAYSTALSLGVNPMPFVVAIMISASSSFATPIGSPTHMMVYGPGGYRFTDYMKIGLILNITIMATALIAIPLIWPF